MNTDLAPRCAGLVAVNFMGASFQLLVMVGTYQNGGRAVWLEDERGELFCTLSVYAYDAQNDWTAALTKRNPAAFYVKHWDGQEAIIQDLVQQGILRRLDEERPVHLGYVPAVGAYVLALLEGGTRHD